MELIIFGAKDDINMIVRRDISSWQLTKFYLSPYRLYLIEGRNSVYDCLKLF